jgi:hypothetical protein
MENTTGAINQTCMKILPDEWSFPYLPPLPTNLKFLDARCLNLETLPPLPPTLVLLLLSGNKKLTCLPSLPDTLEELLIDETAITELPTLPPNLTHLNCSSTNLTALPPLPHSLLHLTCSMSQLTSLPPLPPNLSKLRCDSCQLRSLPRVPVNTDVFCTPNPWIPAFAAILQPTQGWAGSWSISPKQKTLVNRYHEIKAKARNLVNIRHTLTHTELLSDDIVNGIGSFLSGNNRTLPHQIDILRALVLA